MAVPLWTDPKTGLEWSATAPKRMPWIKAHAWCESLGNGWHLPTKNELLSIVARDRFDPAVVDPLLESTVSGYYWSSTTYESYPDDAWYVDFYGGGVDADGKTVGYYVRAVRGIR